MTSEMLIPDALCVQVMLKSRLDVPSEDPTMRSVELRVQSSTWFRGDPDGSDGRFQLGSYGDHYSLRSGT